jgi:putative transposase
MQMIDSAFADLSINKQLELLVLSKSRYYYKSVSNPNKDQDIANQIQELWLKYPFYGYRKITAG